MTALHEISAITDENGGNTVGVNRLKVHYNKAGASDPFICIQGGGPGASGWSKFRGSLQKAIGPG